MKPIRLSALLLLLSIMSIPVTYSASSTLSTAAPIVGLASGENAWGLVFNYEPGVPGSNEVSINGNTLIFTGTFWSENAGWITFNGLGTNTARLTEALDILPMRGYAWSENAGWIIFNPRNSVDTANHIASDAFFQKSTGKFHGFAWSQNLGWMNMEGLMTDITPPSITGTSDNYKAFAADDVKVYTLTDPSVTVPSGASYVFEVENWDSTSNAVYASIAPSFTHDFRQAKEYSLKITDPFGNSSEGKVEVVANIPSDTLASRTILSAMPTEYSSTYTEAKVGDGNAMHQWSMKLKDRYGNPVITVPGIKTASVEVVLNNNVDLIQTLDSGIRWDAILFPGNEFLWLISLSPSGASSNTSGEYFLNIASYAPTKAGYAFTNNDNISLQKLSYQVSAEPGNAWVGEVTETRVENKIGTNELKFTPALSVTNVNNADNWTIRQGYDSQFTVMLMRSTAQALSDVWVLHGLDIDQSLLMSYQNPTMVSGGSKICHGYRQTTSTFQSSYISSNALCNRPESSSLLISPTSLTGDMRFSWRPTIILASPPSSPIHYHSEVSYKINGSSITHPSFAFSSNAATLADGTTVDTTDGVINQSVKIIGLANGKNILNTLNTNTIEKISSLTRTDIKDAIRKNVEILTRWGFSGEGTRFQVYNESKTFSSWPDTTKDTIIIKWGDLTITSDISKDDTNMRGIIVLKDSGGNGGNIYITKDVSSIATVLYADKSIISGTASEYYSDLSPSTQTAVKQLLIDGSVISDNTIGGASMTPLKCPYGVDACDDQIAKRYDLNYFRFYTGSTSTSDGAVDSSLMPAEGVWYPFVIKYDPRLQSAPPPGFSIVP